MFLVLQAAFIKIEKKNQMNFFKLKKKKKDNNKKIVLKFT